MLWFKRSPYFIFYFIILFTEIAFADPNGIVFDWQPFVVKHFRNEKHNGFTLPKNSKVYQEISGNLNYSDEFLPNNLSLINSPPGSAAEKSVLSRIKVSFSTTSSFMLPYDEINSRSHEGKFSRATSILPSLIRNPTQETAIETLKLIEPQLNLGFEF